MKAAYPKHVVLLRGNHESRDMNLYFNFKDECVYKYDILIFEAFTNSFQSLPLAALVHDKYICMHGGISPDLHIISQIFMIDRFHEPPLEGLFCDILWSDPDPNPSVSRAQKFRPNEARGSSFYYSNEAVMEFLENNGLYCLIRAHEVQLDGYKTGPPMKGSEIPSHITIFSAPNYCDQYGNRGAILNIESVDDLNIVQFDASPHPFCLPNFMNVFDWSVPFVAEKVTEILHAILHTGAEPRSTDELAPNTREKILHHESSSELVSILQDHLEAPSHARNNLRAKLKSISRLLGLMRSVRHHVPTSASRQIEESSLERRYSQAAEADYITENRRPIVAGTITKRVLEEECPLLSNYESYLSFEAAVQESTILETATEGIGFALNIGLPALSNLLLGVTGFACPEYLAARVMRFSDYALTAGDIDRARVLAQLANLFKLVSVRNWYRKILNELDHDDVPLETQKPPHVRLYTEIHYRIHSLHNRLHVKRKPLPTVHQQSMMIEIMSICAYPESSEATLVALATHNHIAFSKLHSYPYEMVTEVPEPYKENPQFYKPQLILDWLSKTSSSEFLFLIDCDAFFTNPSMRIETVIDAYGAANLLVAEDSSGINSGVLLVRRSRWSKEFFINVTSHNSHMHMAWDQSMILFEIMKLSNTFNLDQLAQYPPREVAFVFQGHLNAFHEGTAKSWNTYAWQEGDFVLHFAGCPIEESVKVVVGMYRMRLNVVLLVPLVLGDVENPSERVAGILRAADPFWFPRPTEDYTTDLSPEDIEECRVMIRDVNKEASDRGEKPHVSGSYTHSWNVLLDETPGPELYQIFTIRFMSKEFRRPPDIVIVKAAFTMKMRDAKRGIVDFNSLKHQGNEFILSGGKEGLSLSPISPLRSSQSLHFE
ncbi:Serine/threonine-specific protein phosphatase [Perkinsus sp. BL_2016]|nr:Serine/threonine-specific protein phosphatase [Perkinsus sp. BL_2016]